MQAAGKPRRCLKFRVRGIRVSRRRFATSPRELGELVSGENESLLVINLIEELRARGLDIRLLDVVFDILFTHCVRTLQKNPARATRMIAPSATPHHEPPGVMSHPAS
jgi:hypothetical protein